MARFRSAKTLQNFFLLAASYLFYAWWDPRFLVLIFASSMIDFWIGKAIGKAESRSKRKLLLSISLVANLGFLGFFKYFNFFLDSLSKLLASFQIQADMPVLKILLPVGISFYTFQTLSYTIDIYRKTLEPSPRLINFLAFVSFFPQLVAGPIERAAHLLPQFDRERRFEYAKAVKGLRQILWGIFKKVVVADGLAVFVNYVYADSHTPVGIESVLAMLFFTFQIYCDFSAYSDIAIGTASLFGFELSINFRQPLLAKSLREFWSRWHISLSTWFRDYVYFPLGGNQNGRFRTAMNLLAVFTISGLWHGANYTFLVWGILHGIFQVVERNLRFNKLPSLVYQLITILFVVLTFNFFRADSLAHALMVLKGLFEWNGDGVPFAGIESDWLQVFSLNAWIIGSCTLIAFTLFMERWIDFSTGNGIFDRLPKVFRWSIYYSLILLLLVFGAYGLPQQFIYFQF